MSVEALMTRLRRLPADALFSHQTAGWLHGLDIPACEPVEITLPQRSRTSHLSGVSLTRSDYYDDEACDARGLPATSPIRTVADLARRSNLVEAVVILDTAVRARLVELDQLRGWLDTHRRHRGAGRLEHAISLADPASESPMETRLRVLLVAEGLPKPHVRYRYTPTRASSLPARTSSSPINAWSSSTTAEATATASRATTGAATV